MLELYSINLKLTVLQSLQVVNKLRGNTFEISQSFIQCML